MGVPEGCYCWIIGSSTYASHVNIIRRTGLIYDEHGMEYSDSVPNLGEKC